MFIDVILRLPPWHWLKGLLVIVLFICHLLHSVIIAFQSNCVESAIKQQATSLLALYFILLLVLSKVYGKSQLVQLAIEPGL